jgi:hypothetical protein
MSWFSQFIHNPGQFVTHHPWKALGLLGAPLAAIAAPFVAPALGGALGLGEAAAGGLAAGELGALTEAGALGAGEAALAGAGEGALGLGTFGEAGAGAGALGFAGEAASPLAGIMPENIAPGFLEAGVGSPSEFYATVPGPWAGGAASTAGTTVPELAGSVPGLVPEESVAFAQGTVPSAEMAAGAPFASTLTDAGASPGMWGGAMNWIKANPMLAAGLGLGGLGMLKNAFGGLPNEKAQKGIAGQEAAMAAANAAQGQNLLGPIQGGPLPGALEQRVTNQLNDANVATKSRFARLGLSGSTMETDAINNNSNRAQELRGTLALQLAQAGMQLMGLANQELGMEAGIFQNLMNAQISQDNALEESIARFAGSAAMANAISNRPTINVKAA